MKPAMFTTSLVLWGSAALEAQTPKCENQRTTLEIRVCLSGELREADSSLKALTDSLKSILGNSGATAVEAASPKWSAYRKAECAAVLESYEGGTEGPVAQLACFVSLTNERRVNLRRLYAGWLR
jgi:uncharacterized protein YecT (DUF1311 family)